MCHGGKALNFPEFSFLSQNLQNEARQSERRLTYKVENSHSKPMKLSILAHFGKPTRAAKPGNHRVVYISNTVQLSEGPPITRHFKFQFQTSTGKLTDLSHCFHFMITSVFVVVMIEVHAHAIVTVCVKMHGDSAFCYLKAFYFS